MTDAEKAKALAEPLRKILAEYDAWTGFNDDGLDGDVIDEARAALAAYDAV